MVEALGEVEDAGRVKFCADWWHANVLHPKPVLVESGAQPVPGLRLTAAAAALAAHMLEGTGNPYAGQEAADHYASEDADIVVCGTVLYKQGSADPATYRVLFATYEMWRHWDHHLALAEPEARRAEPGLRVPALLRMAEGDQPGGRAVHLVYRQRHGLGPGAFLRDLGGGEASER